MTYKATVIVVDCPWSFNDKLLQSNVARGAESNYPILTIEELKKLPIADISDPSGALLALWCPSSLLPNGLQLMDAWQFNFKQTLIWVKVKKNIAKVDNINNTLAFGMGRIFRQTHELCLIGTNNNGIYRKLKNRSQRSVLFSQNEKHSKKPEELQNRLEIMFPDAIKCELFARRERNGWLCLGNEVGQKEDIRTSLQKLINNQPIVC
jgi:N6-adenosine-specific RNA methylase IME4